MHTDRCVNTRRQKCCTKGSGKELKIQEFTYRDKTNVERETYNYTCYNWNHWNSNENLNEKFGIYTRKNSIYSLKKTAILGTSYIIREVLQCEA